MKTDNQHTVDKELTEEQTARMMQAAKIIEEVGAGHKNMVTGYAELEMVFAQTTG